MSSGVNKIVRVRHHVTGDLGWYDTKSFAIRCDDDPSLRLMAFWQRNSVENQEDFGYPAEGYGTAYGWWVPVEK